jgi:hypothetical protein
MSDDLPLTELLRHVQSGDEDAFMVLLNRFLGMARQMALKELARYPRAVYEQAGGAIVGMEALRSTLSYVGEIEKDIASRNDFFTLLRTVIRNKIADIARGESQSIKRNKELSDVDEPPAKVPGPAEELIRKETDERLAELAARAVKLIHEIEDPLERTVAELGLIRFYTASEIRDFLLSNSPEHKVPAISTILVMLRRIKRRLARELGEEDV